MKLFIGSFSQFSNCLSLVGEKNHKSIISKESSLIYKPPGCLVLSLVIHLDSQFRQ